MTSAQGFDSISQPPDFSIKQNEEASITWEVTIDSVTTPTFDVYINSIAYISDFSWILVGTTGTITINVDSARNPGIYNYTIVVDDGDGHTILDEVMITIEERSRISIWFERYGYYIVFGTILVVFMTLLVLNRQRAFKKGQSVI